MREKWWLHGRSRPALRTALASLDRYIVTPEVAKHRIFAWVNADVIPDHKLHVIARGDDYFFGVLHSRVHEIWTLSTCSWMGVGNDPSYNSSTTFEAFPFPWPPGEEEQDHPVVSRIAQAARLLVQRRNAWLNSADSSESVSKRTLTALYNHPPQWLTDLHASLDATVLAAYKWPANISDEEVMTRLLALNKERGERQMHPRKKDAGSVKSADLIRTAASGMRKQKSGTSSI